MLRTWGDMTMGVEGVFVEVMNQREIKEVLNF